MLLVFATLACLALGWWVDSVRRQRDAVDAILNAGAMIEYRGSWCGIAQRSIGLGRQRDSHSVWLDFWRTPTYVQVLDSASGDTILENLPALPTITMLELFECCVSKEGIPYLARCPNLEYLLIYRTRISNSDLKCIAQMKSLKCLDLDEVKISDEGLRHLAQLKTLRYLSLGATDVTAVGIKELGRTLPECEIVH